MIICRCNEVHDSEIQHFLKKHPHATLKELQLSTKASTTCGRCLPEVEKIYGQFQQDHKPIDQLRISF